VNILDKMPNNLIGLMLKEGLIFSIAQNARGTYLDLNTSMKSHAYLYYENDKYILRMRYENEAVVETLEDIAYWIKHCLQGREYMNGSWMSIVDKGFGPIEFSEI